MHHVQLVHNQHSVPKYLHAEYAEQYVEHLHIGLPNLPHNVGNPPYIPNIFLKGMFWRPFSLVQSNNYVLGHAQPARFTAKDLCQRVLSIVLKKKLAWALE